MKSPDRGSCAQSHRHAGEPMVEQWLAALDAHRHSHSIDLGQNVLWEIVVKIPEADPLGVRPLISVGGQPGRVISAEQLVDLFRCPLRFAELEYPANRGLPQHGLHPMKSPHMFAAEIGGHGDCRQ